MNRIKTRIEFSFHIGKEIIMPLVGEGNDVYIEYIIPEYIRNLITDDFLK